MKRITAIILTVLLLASFAGCNKAQPVSQPDIQDAGTGTKNSVSETVATESANTETYSQNQTAPTLPEGAITNEEAVDVALKKAGLKKTDIIGLWCELDYDDGRLIYEVDFSDGKFDYDCDVDAKSGKILKYEKEIDD